MYVCVVIDKAVVVVWCDENSSNRPCDVVMLYNCVVLEFVWTYNDGGVVAMAGVSVTPF